MEYPEEKAVADESRNWSDYLRRSWQQNSRRNDMLK
jgi:hypothetical protein